MKKNCSFLGGSRIQRKMLLPHPHPNPPPEGEGRIWRPSFRWLERFGKLIYGEFEDKVSPSEGEGRILFESFPNIDQDRKYLVPPPSRGRLGGGWGSLVGAKLSR